MDLQYAWGPGMYTKYIGLVYVDNGMFYTY